MSTQKDIDTDLNPDSKHVTEHLANDRTYLAWMRTGISMMGLGVVIAKLRFVLDSKYSDASGVMQAAHIGIWFAVAGVITIIVSVVFFLQTQQEIRESRFRAKKYFALILAFLTVSLGLTILWYLKQPIVLSSVSTQTVQSHE